MNSGFNYQIRAVLISFSLFLLLSTISVYIARFSDNVAVFWPANAAMVAIALFLGPGHLISVLFGTYAANAVTQAIFGDNLIAIFGFPIANTLEVAMVALGIRWLGLKLEAQLTPNAALVLLAVVATAALPAAAIGSYVVFLIFTAPFWDTFIHWWAGDIVSSMIVFMPLFAFVREDGIRSLANLIRASNPFEWFVVALSSFVGIFVLVAIYLPPVIVLVIPLIWLALKGRVFEVALVGSLLSLATSAAVVTGVWPEFSQNLTLRDAVFQQQTLALFCTFPTYLIAIAVDNLRRSQRQVEARHDILDTMLTHMNEGVSMFDREGRLKIWNQKYLDIFGVSKELIVPNVRFVDLLNAQKESGDFHGDPQQYQDAILGSVNRGHVHKGETVLESGKVIKTMHAPVPGGGWIGTHDDVTDVRLLERKLAYEARHDALTGLANRRFFDQKIVETLKVARQEGSGVALLTIDLDNFKTINDAYGHEVGDGVLRWAANQMRLASGNAHFIARIGGDEFMLLMNKPRLDIEEVADVASGIVDLLANTFEIDGYECVCGASVGIVYSAPCDLDRKQLLVQSDVALYAAKKSGRGQYRFYQSDEAQTEANAKTNSGHFAG